MKKVLVKDLIKSLQKFDENRHIEIEIRQCNQKYPIAYCELNESSMVDGMYATSRNGQDVRLTVTLPHDNETMMITQKRKR